jgi:hypothetical protein
LEEARRNYTAFKRSNGEDVEENEAEDSGNNIQSLQSFRDLDSVRPHAAEEEGLKTLLLVTGRGNHVNSRGERGVLRHDIEGFLAATYPDLAMTHSRNNDGCLIITSESLLAWLSSRSFV